MEVAGKKQTSKQTSLHLCDNSLVQSVYSLTVEQIFFISIFIDYRYNLYSIHKSFDGIVHSDRAVTGDKADS